MSRGPTIIYCSRVKRQVLCCVCFNCRWVCTDVPELKLAMENYVLNKCDTSRYGCLCVA